MTNLSSWKKMFATLALGGLMLTAPQLANADIASDIAAGKNAAVVAQEAVRGGMAPVQAAIEADKAAPQSAVEVAVVVAEENPAAAVEIAGALAQAQPEQSVEIVRAVSELYPDRAADVVAAAAKLVCGDDQRKKYMTQKKEDLLDVCSSLSSVNLVPATIIHESVDVTPGTNGNALLRSDRNRASGI
ncbi:MAG: hypothetical protein LBH14_08510 [Desulfobulbaceae bacterium]|jgi:hypothetical protein|nr:hypothetical protein [Desulfobulbaceae bacterium]